MIKKLDIYNYSEFASSLFEKYSFAILQLLSTILLTHLYGFDSLGIIGSYTLIISISTVFSEAGSAVLIQSLQNPDKKVISESFFLSLLTSSLIYIIVMFLFLSFKETIKVEKNIISGFYFYSLLIFFAPLQLISHSVMIMLRKVKELTYINIISWALAVVSIFYIFYNVGDNKYYIVFYFIILSLFRFILAIYLIIKYKLIVIEKMDFRNIKERISLIFSQLSITFSQNIWTTIIVLRLNLEANAVYSLFVKLRDLSVGNLSHALHRIAIKWVKPFSLFNDKSTVKGLKIVSFGSIFFVFFAWMLKSKILMLFNNNNSEYNQIIMWVLLVAILYPINDYFKCLLKKHHQSFVLKIDVFIACIIFILTIIIEDIYILLALYFVFQLFVSLLILCFDKKNKRI